MSDWKPRRIRGAINWNAPTLRAQLHIALSEGVSLVQLADRWGVPVPTMHHQVERRGLAVMPPDRIGIMEAAEVLNLTQVGVHALCRRQGVPMGYWGKLRTLTHEQMTLLARRERIVRERPFGYVTVFELARSWRLDTRTVRARLKGLPRLAWVGHSARVVFLYDLRDVSPRAPSVAPATCPAGRWTTAELASALGVGRPVVTGWVGLGCPVLKGRKNCYFKPVEVAQWLLGRKKGLMRTHGQKLTSILEDIRRSA